MHLITPCERENHWPKAESLVLKPVTLNLVRMPDVNAVSALAGMLPHASPSIRSLRINPREFT